MSPRSVLLVVGLAVASTAIAVAAPAAPSKAGAGSGSAAAASTTAAGSGSGSGSAAPVEEPPKDMNGTDENPDAPKVLGEDTPKPTVAVVAPKPVQTGYPTEEVLRPIILPKNMAQISIGPHFEFDDGTRQGFSSSDALRARYSITDRVEVGLTYAFAGIYHDPADASSTMTGAIGLHSGKAVGLDATVLIEKWLAVRVGLPIYVSPTAVSLTLGAPIKFVFFDKLAIGGLDQILNIALDRFAPNFYYEYDNALAAFQTGPGGNNTQQPAGFFTLSAFVDYQYNPKLAVLGRIGIQSSFGGGSSSFAGTGTPGTSETFLRAGLQWTLRTYLDLGFTLGFDDLGHGGTFGPAGILAVRI
jgi:hypothetical protein